MDRVVTALVQARNDNDTWTKVTIIVTQSRKEYLEVL